MSEIISVIGLILATFTGAFGMNFWKVLEEWQTSPTKMTLWKSYGLCFVCVVLLNLAILLWRLFCVEGGASFFPDYIRRLLRNGLQEASFPPPLFCCSFAS